MSIPSRDLRDVREVHNAAFHALLQCLIYPKWSVICNDILIDFVMHVVDVTKQK